MKTMENMGMVLSDVGIDGRKTWKKRFTRNADGSLCLPLCGIVIGGNHTAFPGDKVWDDWGIIEGPQTFVGWCDGEDRILKDRRSVRTEEGSWPYWPEQLFPSPALAAKSRRKRLMKLYKKHRKWMRIYREGIRDCEKIINREPTHAK